MKQILSMVLAVAAGFMGGTLAPHILAGRSREPDGVVRARGFELLDGAGRVISYWGVDRPGNAVLTFGSHWPDSATQPGPEAANKQGNRLTEVTYQRATIGVIDDVPFLDFRSGDGRSRVRMYSNEFGKPMLLMHDEAGPRVLLGVAQSDTPSAADNTWQLLFNDDAYHPIAQIAVFPDVRHGGHVRGALFVDKGK